MTSIATQKCVFVEYIFQNVYSRSIEWIFQFHVIRQPEIKTRHFFPYL